MEIYYFVRETTFDLSGIQHVKVKYLQPSKILG